MRLLRKLTAAVIILFVIVLAWSIIGTINHQIAIDRKMDALCNHIWEEYKELGLDVPKDLRKYYTSIIGSPCKIYLGSVRMLNTDSIYFPLDQSYMTNVKLDWKVKLGPNHEPFIVICKTKCVIYERRFLITRHYTKRQDLKYFLPTKSQKTATLLYSVSAGTKLWKKSLQPVLIGTKPDPIPHIAFNHPNTNKQLDEYWQWLEMMVGIYRFRDGWGNRVKLVLDDKSELPALVASSAGPDSKCGTKDDMILKRDAKNGKVIAEIGFKDEHVLYDKTREN